MRRIQKLLTCILIFLILTACRIERTSTPPFYDFIGSYDNAEPDHGYSSYVELKSGEKVYAKYIRFPGTTMGKQKNGVKINKVYYDHREVSAVYDGTHFFRPTEYGFARRIIRGKLNIYSLYGNYGSGAPYFIQKGETEDLKLLKRVGELREYLEDCPLAIEIFDDGNANLVQRKKQNNYFMSTAIYRYNNNCTE